MGMDNIGVSNIHNMAHRISLRSNKAFNIVIAGRNGLGKTTFIQSLLKVRVSEADPVMLYNLDLEDSEPFSGSPDERKDYILSFQENKFKINEGDMLVDLTITEIDGVGDQTDNRRAIEPILAYIEKQNSIYYNNEKMKVPA